MSNRFLEDLSISMIWKTTVLEIAQRWCVMAKADELCSSSLIPARGCKEARSAARG